MYKNIKKPIKKENQSKQPSRKTKEETPKIKVKK